MPIERFTYEDLQAGYVRLLKFIRHDSNTTGPVDFRLESVHIDDLHDYFALSYRWDEIDAPVSLVVNGKALKIKTNLARFLLHWQDHNVMFWIDAICINQANKVERAEQVSLMSIIFGRAQTVISWLGVGEPKIEQLFECVHAMEHAEDWQDSFEMMDASHIEAFCGLEYWSRMWIVQEMLLPQTVVLKYGAFQFTWDQVWDLVRYIGWTHSSVPAEPHEEPPLIKASSAYKLLGRRPLRGKVTKYNLVDLISTFSTFQSSETRDRLFALFSLSKQSLSLAPNYRASLAQITLDTVVALDGDLDLLGNVASSFRLSHRRLQEEAAARINACCAATKITKFTILRCDQCQRQLTNIPMSAIGIDHFARSDFFSSHRIPRGKDSPWRLSFERRLPGQTITRLHVDSATSGVFDAQDPVKIAQTRPHERRGSHHDMNLRLLGMCVLVQLINHLTSSHNLHRQTEKVSFYWHEIDSTSEWAHLDFEGPMSRGSLFQRPDAQIPVQKVEDDGGGLDLLETPVKLCPDYTYLSEYALGDSMHPLTLSK